MGQKTDSHHGKDHLLGGADPIPGVGSLNTTGWTVALGGPLEPVVTGVDQIAFPVPREIVGDGTSAWYIFSPSAGVYTPSSSGAIEIMIGRIRSDGTGTGFSVEDNLLDVSIFIDATENSSRSAATQTVVSQYGYLQDNDTFGGSYDFLTISVLSAGVGATGLSVNIPIGIERVAGSGYH